MEPLKTPDFTPEAIAAVLILIVTNAIILFGLDFSSERQAAITGLVNGVVLVGFLVHSAIIRHGRATGNTQR